MQGERGEPKRNEGGRWVLFSTSAALFLFAVGPVPRSAAAARAAEATRLATSAPSATCVARAAAPPRAWSEPSLALHHDELYERLVEGIVVTEDGPVPGLRIAIGSGAGTATGSGPSAVFTDEEGRFRSRSRGDVARNLRVLGAAGATLEGPPLPALGDECRALRWELDWRLVRVRLCRAEGAALSGLAVCCSASDGGQVFAVRHATDAEGHFALLVRGTDEVELSVELNRAAPERARFHVGSREHLWRVDER